MHIKARHGLAISIFFTFHLVVFNSVQVLAACPQCNVILISLDTVGAKHLSLYGASRKTSPNIDSFAKRSRVYKNAYATAPWTLPSHGSMLTGMYPGNLYPPKVFGYLSESIKTMAEILKKRGYKTAAFTDGYYLSKHYKFNRGFETFDAQFNAFKNIGMKRNLKKGLGFIQKNTKKPFFLFLHTYDAHGPFTPKVEAIRAIGGAEQAPASVSFQQIFEMNQKDKNTPEMIEKVKLLYQAEIFEIDEHLAYLFVKLDKLRLLKNTMVIITSDHGEEFGEHGNWGLHAHSVYNELLHIPLVFYIPNELPKEISSPVSLTDLLPTVLDQLKINAPSSLDGVPLPEVDNIIAMSRKVFAIGANSSRQELLNLILTTKLQDPLPRLAASSFQKETPRLLESALITKDKKFILSHSNLEITEFDLATDPQELFPKTLKCADAACEILKLFSNGRKYQ